MTTSRVTGHDPLRISLGFLLLGVLADVLTTLYGLLRIPGYERNGVVLSLSLPVSLALTLACCLMLTLSLRRCTGMSQRARNALTALLLIVGLSRWLAAGVAMLGFLGDLP